MSRIRLLFAWLLLAAIPLQGLAASSMLFCGMGMEHTPIQAQSAMHTMASSSAVTTGAHDHSQHGHIAAAEVMQAAGDATGEPPKPSVAAHKCPVCASSCNLVAILEIACVAAAFMPPVQADPAEPFVLIHARPLPVPDKPPRA